MPVISDLRFPASAAGHSTMRALLSRPHYVDPDIFRREQVRIFGDLWIFAGLTNFVAESDQFLTRRIGGRSIVVQNFEGTPRAFENVCSHRSKVLQTGRFGRHPLVCGYHGWRYANDGAVATIPFASECYRLDPAERAALRLREFALCRIGKLLFVNLSESPRSIDDQFYPELLREIESASNAFDDEIMVTTVAGRYNWKLAYENLRDSLHPKFVHTRSLNLDVEFYDGVAAEPVADAREDGRVDLRDLSFGGAEGGFRRPRPLPFHARVARWGTEDAYFNWLLYPNTHMVCPDGGYSFSIEHHEPLGVDSTELTLFFATARRDPNFAGTDAVLWEYAKGAKTILDEDQAIMEEAQAGLDASSSAVVQGHFELQNRITDRWYLGQLQ